MMVRYSPDDWKRNLETILPWSPYASEEDLLQQVSLLIYYSLVIVLVRRIYCSHYFFLSISIVLFMLKKSTMINKSPVMSVLATMFN